MTKDEPTAGFTLVEVLVAVLLLSVIALALTNTLLGVQRARAVSERWMQATQLAVEGIEQLRASHGIGPILVSGNFTRTGTATAWAGHPSVSRLDVTVSWNDGQAHTLQLSSLVRQ